MHRILCDERIYFFSQSFTDMLVCLQFCKLGFLVGVNTLHNIFKFHKDGAK